MVSIVLASTTEVDAIRDIVVKAGKDFDNLRAAAYWQPGGWRWHSVHGFGMVGVDAVTLDDATLLRPSHSTLIPSFPAIAPASNALWMPRVNLAIHHPHLESAELARAVACQWPGLGQVSIRAFDERQSAADNAAVIVSGALERSDQDGWPAHPRAEFHSWLSGLRRGLQPLGISSRPLLEKDVLRAEHFGDFMVGTGRHSGEIEPMPVLF